jgi:hypothetical protein
MEAVTNNKADFPRYICCLSTNLCGCGLQRRRVHNNTTANNMAMRHSVARRTSLNVGSPAAIRSRSAERGVRHPADGVYLDFDSDHNKPPGDGSFIADEDGANYPNRERLSSESSMSKQVRSHRRAMSDPFDTADSGGVTDADLATVKDNGLLEKEEHGLPTLARFPFAETQDTNCWSESPLDIFQIRGPDYLKDKKKVTAQSYLLRARGCDLFLADEPGQCETAK